MKLYVKFSQNYTNFNSLNTHIYLFTLIHITSKLVEKVISYKYVNNYSLIVPAIYGKSLFTKYQIYMST